MRPRPRGGSNSYYSIPPREMEPGRVRAAFGDDGLARWNRAKRMALTYEAHGLDYADFYRALREMEERGLSTREGAILDRARIVAEPRLRLERRHKEDE